MANETDLLLSGEDLIAPGFEEAAISLAENSYTLIPDFLSPLEVDQVLEVLQERIDRGEFKKAGIGKEWDFQLNKQVRGDYIRWIDKEDSRKATRVVLSRLDLLKQTLNRVCFLGLKDYETHFAYFPKGTQYKRHLDQFNRDDKRRISFALYLNKNWQVGDGGELRLYFPLSNGSEASMDIAPKAGTLMMLRSDIIEHEVRPVNKERYSITGWMLDQMIL